MTYVFGLKKQFTEEITNPKATSKVIVGRQV